MSTTPEIPQSRDEKWLNEIAGKLYDSTPEEPQSRIEKWLKYIAENGIELIENDAMNIVKINKPLTDDITIVPLNSIVFPLDRVTAHSVIAQLPEPYKTYLSQLESVHPMSDWKNTANDVLSWLQKSAYNMVIDNGLNVGVVVGFVNSQTMSVINPDSMVVYKVMKTDLSKIQTKFADIYNDVPNVKAVIPDVVTTLIDVSNNQIFQIQASNNAKVYFGKSNGQYGFEVQGNQAIIRATYIEMNGDKVATERYVNNMLTTLHGYDRTKTQVLKNINGTFTWVNE